LHELQQFQLNRKKQLSKRPKNSLISLSKSYQEIRDIFFGNLIFYGKDIALGTKVYDAPNYIKA